MSLYKAIASLELLQEEKKALRVLFTNNPYKKTEAEKIISTCTNKEQVDYLRELLTSDYNRRLAINNNTIQQNHFNFIKNDWQVTVIDTSHVCFSLHSKVILADGKRIEISQLSIGDKVCCGEENGELIFREIYAIVHADDRAVTQYRRIDYRKTDGTEGVLRLSPKHHLFVSQGKTIFAEDVQAHITELLFLDDRKLIPVIPHQVTKEWELGYIAPFTQNGKIVVDDILCSCYAVAPPYQEIINFALIPFRLYSWMKALWT